MFLLARKYGSGKKGKVLAGMTIELYLKGYILKSIKQNKKLKSKSKLVFCDPFAYKNTKLATEQRDSHFLIILAFMINVPRGIKQPPSSSQRHQGQGAVSESITQCLVMKFSLHVSRNYLVRWVVYCQEIKDLGFSVSEFKS